MYIGDMLEFLTFILLLTVVYIFFKISSLENKINEILKNQTPNIQKQSENLAYQSLKVPSNEKSVPAVSATQTSTQINYQDTGEDVLTKFFKWFAKDWPLKTGAFFVLLGFLWFLTYAFLNNWIGPVGRITLGIIFGSAMIYFGELRMKSIKPQGITLIGLGSGVMMFSVYAAYNLYEMFPAFVALGFIIIVSLVISYISSKYSSISLGVFSLIIAGILPLIIGCVPENTLILMTYLFSLTVGAIFLGYKKSWDILTTISIFVIVLYLQIFIGKFNPNVIEYATPKELMQLRFFATLMASTFFFSINRSVIKSSRINANNLVNASILPVVTVFWIRQLVYPDYRSLVITFLAIVYGVIAYLASKRTDDDKPMIVTTTISSILLALATAIHFEDVPSLLVAFSIEALVLPILAHKYIGSKTAKIMLLYYFPAGLLTIMGYLAYFDPNQVVPLIISSCSFIISGLYFYHEEESEDWRNLSVPMIIIGSVFSLSTIWKILHGYIDKSYIADLISLTIFTFVGLTSYFMGEINNRKIKRNFGIGVLIFVIAHLLLVDIWNMALTLRIITFFIIGGLFMGSVLIRKK